MCVGEFNVVGHVGGRGENGIRGKNIGGRRLKGYLKTQSHARDERILDRTRVALGWFEQSA